MFVWAPSPASRRSPQRRASSERAAVVIGTASAIFCYACVYGLTKMGYDDALDVWGVHGMGGFLGTCSWACWHVPASRYLGLAVI